MSHEIQTPNCKKCGCDNVIKNGVRSLAQRYKCKNCNHSFTKNDGRTKIERHKKRIAAFLALHELKLSLQEIVKMFNVKEKTIERWIKIEEESFSQSKKDIELSKVDNEYYAMLLKLLDESNKFSKSCESSCESFCECSKCGDHKDGNNHDQDEEIDIDLSKLNKCNKELFDEVMSLSDEEVEYFNSWLNQKSYGEGKRKKKGKRDKSKNNKNKVIEGITSSCNSLENSLEEKYHLSKMMKEIDKMRELLGSDAGSEEEIFMKLQSLDKRMNERDMWNAMGRMSKGYRG